MENISEINEECATKIDIPGSLPIEIFHKMMLYLNGADYHQMQDCCKKWRDCVESVWERQCKIDCYFESEDDLNSKLYQQFTERYSPWEALFQYNRKLETKWAFQIYRVAVNHTDDITRFEIKYFFGDTIIGIYDHKEIWIMNAGTAKVEKRFPVVFPEFPDMHYRIYTCEKIKNSLMAVIGVSPKIGDYHYEPPKFMYFRTWNIETEEPSLSLQMEALKNNIADVYIHKHLIAVRTYHMADIYNIKTEKYEYQYNQLPVNRMCCYNDKIAIGNKKSDIVIIDLNYTELMTLKCCKNNREIVQIQMEAHYLIALTQCIYFPEYRGHIWNMETKTKLYQVKRAIWEDMGIYFHENKLCYYYGNNYKDDFKLCNLDTGHCILEIENGRTVVTNNYFIIQKDIYNYGIINVWLIRTGTLLVNLPIITFLPINFSREKFHYPKKPKSKFAYVDYDDGIQKWTLKIVNYQSFINLGNEPQYLICPNTADFSVIY